ncbi:hypothetical protein [Polynucleobacter necessarius]|uniref:hypothetical protein n=1 Tax=Polynucleobacter necessarius TaxID=576610 RepID=UPI0013B06CBA|nr:hypothetical protein [Polynucleobacter necessarius]
MKKLLLISSIALGLLGGCASNENISTQSNVATMQSKPSIAPSKSASAPKPKDDIQNEIALCIQAVNEGKTAQSINGTIFALDPANPSSKFLYSSPNKLSTDETVLLAKFKRETQKCRQIAMKIQNPSLRKVYQNYFAKIDRVYDGLIYKKITTGVANQERSLLMTQFKMQFLDTLNK